MLPPGTQGLRDESTQLPAAAASFAENTHNNKGVADYSVQSASSQPRDARDLSQFSE